MSRRHIQKAIDNVGGVRKAMVRFKRSRASIYNWLSAGVVPPEIVPEVEEASGVSRHDLNPKIHPRPKGAGK